MSYLHWTSAYSIIETQDIKWPAETRVLILIMLDSSIRPTVGYLRTIIKGLQQGNIALHGDGQKAELVASSQKANSAKLSFRKGRKSSGRDIRSFQCVISASYISIAKLCHIFLQLGVTVVTLWMIYYLFKKLFMKQTATKTIAKSTILSFSTSATVTSTSPSTVISFQIMAAL